MRILVSQIGFWSMLALGAARVRWLELLSPRRLAHTVAISLIAYRFTRHAHVRWAWSSYHDAKTGAEVVVHRHNELGFRYFGALILLRLLLSSLPAVS